MSVLTYRGMKLGVAHLREGIWEAVTSADDANYLMTKVTLDVDAVILNPSIVSFPFSQDDKTPPLNNAGEFAGSTWKAIRHHLMQKRGRLTFAAGGVIVLESPDQNIGIKSAIPDSWNGPHPERCEFIRVTGNKSIEISFRITTYINECGGPLGNRRVLLSHRWKRYVDIDQDQFAQIVTEGEAVFNTAQLAWSRTFPDQYRRNLFHAIPQNFRRNHIHVQPSEDGASVRYRTVDREMPFNTPQQPRVGALLMRPLNATRIEAFQTGFYQQQGLMQTIDHGVRVKFRNLAHAAMLAAGSTFGSGAFLGIGGASLLTAVEIAEHQLPRYNLHFIVRAHGHRNSTRSSLQSLVLGIIFARLERLGITRNNYRQFYSMEFQETQELTGKYVECLLTISWGEEIVSGTFGEDPLEAGREGARIDEGRDGFLARGPSISLSRDAGINTILGTFNIPGEETRPWLDSRPEIVNTPPPNSGGTRGTWIGQLMAQALSEPCSSPTYENLRGVDATTSDLKLEDHDFPV